jgi:hypothetical protein
MLVVVGSAKPHGLVLLLQEEKQITPKIQIAINTTFSFKIILFRAQIYKFFSFGFRNWNSFFIF